MTLSFSQQIDGSPNYFIEKIWLGLLIEKLVPSKLCGWHAKLHLDKFGKEWDAPTAEFKVNNCNGVFQKLHTIRFDPHKRWRSGMDIHPVINNRTPNRFQFAPTIKCKLVQRIDIKFPDGSAISYTRPCIFVDGLLLNEFDSEKLAINDGFDSVGAFFKYFKDGIIDGSLIHWTDTKY